MSGSIFSGLKIALAVISAIAVAGWGFFLSERSDLQQVEANLLNKNKALQENRTEKNSLNEQVHLAQNKVETLEGVLANDQATKERLGNELKKLADQRLQLESRLIELKKHLQGKSTQLAQTKDELEKTSAEIAKRMQELTSVQEHLAAISDELNHSYAVIDRRDHEIARLKTLREEEAKSFADLKKALKTQIDAKNIEVRNLRDQITVIEVGAKAMFRSGSSTLSKSGQQVLDKVIVLLKNLPDRLVSIEGYTDNLPLGEKLIKTYNSNWELSAHRAAAAVRYLQANGVDPGRMQVVGYGEYHPVADNETAEGRAKNRRIEIRLRPGANTLPRKMLPLGSERSDEPATGQNSQEE